MALVLQTVTASQRSTALPPTTGQILLQETADATIAANIANAPAQGLTVNSDGSITDAASGITIKQGYVPADPFYDNPTSPLCGGAPPSPPTIQPQTWGAGTLKIFTFGQSHASNNGRFRFTSRGAGAWIGCFKGGSYYGMSDPVPFADGTDGSLWPLFADAAISRSMPGGLAAVNRVLIGGYPRGGSSIADFATGGQYHVAMIAELQAFIAANGQPTFVHLCQGPADILSMSTTQWFNTAFSVVTAIRQAGCTSKIAVDTDTICAIRTSTDPGPNQASARSALDLIGREIGRLNIRAAQAQLAGFNSNFCAGMNVDAIDWRWRAYGDGCHGGEMFLRAHAQGLAATLLP